MMVALATWRISLSRRPVRRHSTWIAGLWLIGLCLRRIAGVVSVLLIAAAVLRLRWWLLGLRLPSSSLWLLIVLSRWRWLLTWSWYATIWNIASLLLGACGWRNSAACLRLLLLLLWLASR